MTKKRFQIVCRLLLFFVLLLIPSVVSAAAPAKITLPDPLGTTNILDLGARLIQAGLGIAGSLALLFFIYGGFLWLTSGGTPDKIKKGRDVFLWSTVGLVIIFSSYMMVDFVIKAITAATSQKKCVAAAEDQQAKNLADCVFKYANDLSGHNECSSVITEQYNEQIKSCN